MPKGMALNASGSAVKMKPAPPPAGSRPKEITIGKIAMPATSATMVSAKATVTPTRGMFTSDGR